MGIQLLQVIRNGNVKQALKLLCQNADVSVCDQVRITYTCFCEANNAFLYQLFTFFLISKTL